MSTAQDKFSRLDELAAPTSYVAPSTEEELGYLAYFRQVCKRYNIVFADADSDERDFVIRMAEKGYYPKRAWWNTFDWISKQRRPILPGRRCFVST